MHTLPRLTLLIGSSCLITGVVSCQHTTAPRAPDASRVLIVGNSLTYTNDLPGTINTIARQAGVSLTVESVTGGGLALIDHLTGSTNAAQRIKEGGWGTIVLQQGPTTVGLCRDSLVLWTQLFAERASAVHANVALFMTWPALGVSPGGFDDVRVSYQAAAFAVNGIFLPAGEAWRAAMRADASIAPYGDDNFHPSEIGTYLAALTIFERLSNTDVRTLAPTAYIGSRTLSLSAATVRTLQQAAHDANIAYPARITAPVSQPSPPGTTVPGGHC